MTFKSADCYSLINQIKITDNLLINTDCLNKRKNKKTEIRRIFSKVSQQLVKKKCIGQKITLSNEYQMTKRLESSSRPMLQMQNLILSQTQLLNNI